MAESCAMVAYLPPILVKPLADERGAHLDLSKSWAGDARHPKGQVPNYSWSSRGPRDVP